MFPQNYTRFDYPKLIKNNEFDDTVFSKYYQQEMENFLVATTSQRGKHQKEDSSRLDLKGPFHKNGYFYFMYYHESKGKFSPDIDWLDSICLWVEGHKV